MSEIFEKWESKFREQDLNSFNNDSTGILWLKTKSLARKGILEIFVKYINYTIKSKKVNDQFVELFDFLLKDVNKSHNLINDFSKENYKEQIKNLNLQEIEKELFKLKYFEWGGDHNNSLDKYLVNNYVKRIRDYDALITKLDNDIKSAVQGYVLNSWYNHWSTILIEHIFKKHELVVPTNEHIKSVDFFVNNIPFDLKVTYLSKVYIKNVRQKLGYDSELNYLKARAKVADIDYNNDGKEVDIIYEIIEKMRISGDMISNETLDELTVQREEVFKDIENNKKDLAIWNYENQGELRFGSENRIFLILIDPNNLSSSWKLKRHFNLLDSNITSYINRLDSGLKKNYKDYEVTFQYNDNPKTFTALTDVLFIKQIT